VSYQVVGKHAVSSADEASVNPSLHQALKTLYVDKRVPQSVGEFGRILLIHGLFHQTWLVLGWYTSPLNVWQPHSQAKVNEGTDAPVVSRPWAPSITEYAQWRNSACDCLDVLHWRANALIGLAAGREHPTVFFLHLARIVILAPIDSIRIIASASSGVAAFSQTALDEAKNEVFRWAREDKFKARLAVVHAGSLLYHVRRYSIDAFYEPWGLFLSTLTLWAFSIVSAQSAPLPTARAGEDPSGDDESVPSFIHIDRPSDDELIQLYILQDTPITALLQGVGDLCTLEGSRKVLKEGCKLLRELRSWDLGTECLPQLTLLSDAMEV